MRSSCKLSHRPGLLPMSSNYMALSS